MVSISRRWCSLTTSCVIAETARCLLCEGDSPTLKPLTDAGSGSVQEKEKARLGEIIARVNDLFGADTTEGDKLVYCERCHQGQVDGVGYFKAASGEQ